MSGVLRVVVRAAGMAWLLLYIGPLYLREKWRRAPGGAPWCNRWSQKVLRAVMRVSGCRVEARGTVPSSGLLVANHVSYLDVGAIGSLAPCCFVAKSEVRQWPLVGWLGARGGTIFVRRADRTGAAAQVEELRRALGAGGTVVLFAEGTSSDGRQVLPFGSSLLQAAIEAGVPVAPVSVRYRVPPPADAATDACWWGDMKLLPHLLHLWSLPWTAVSVSFGAARMPGADRKAEARRLQREVAAMASLPASQHGRPATCFRGAAS